MQTIEKINAEADKIHQEASMMAGEKAKSQADFVFSLLENSPSDWDFLYKVIYDAHFNFYYSQQSSKRQMESMRKRYETHIMQLLEGVKS